MLRRAIKFLARRALRLRRLFRQVLLVFLGKLSTALLGQQRARNYSKRWAPAPPNFYPNFYLQGSQYKEIREARKKLEALRDIHLGQPGWIIGNGPSLRIDDLSALGRKISIGSNKIYLAFESTTWRPTYYTASDEILWPKIADALPSEIRTVFLSSRLNSSSCKQETVLFRILPEVPSTAPKKHSFSADASEGFSVARTVTLLNIQFASFLGLNPIFLTGIDHVYKGESGQGGIETHTVQNHFDQRYRSPGEVVFGANLSRMTEAYSDAQLWAQARGITILNASRKSELNVFPRIDFEEAICFG